MSRRNAEAESQMFAEKTSRRFRFANRAESRQAFHDRDASRSRRSGRGRRIQVERLEDRRLLASLNANYLFQLQSHEVIPDINLDFPDFIGVEDVRIGPADHLSVLVTPANQSFTDADGDGRADEDCLFASRPGHPFAVSLGAGPETSSLLEFLIPGGDDPFPIPGRLVADFNRTRDIDPVSPTKFRTSLPSPTDIRASHEQLDLLLRTLDGYDDRLNYDFFPGSGYNSNSFISGLLNRNGLGVSQAELDAAFPLTLHPGFGKPVPSSEFPLSEKKRTDLVFVIDTTGSMGDDIDRVKAAANRIIAELQENTLDARISVVEYRDHPPQGDFPWRAVESFTCQAGTANAGIQSLAVSGGGDTPEALFGALRFAMDSSNLGFWRGGTVEKKVIFMTDAPAHSPEPVTGLDYADIVQLARDGGIDLSAEGEEIDDERVVEEPIQIFPVIIGNNSAALQTGEILASETGGTVFRADGAEDVVDALLGAISSATGGGGAEIIRRAVPGPLGIPANTGGTTEIWFHAEADQSIALIPIGVHGARTVELISDTGSVMGRHNSSADIATLFAGNTYGLRFSAHDEASAFYLTSNAPRGMLTAVDRPGSAEATTSFTASRAEAEDVNADGNVSPRDALVVLNEIRRERVRGRRTGTFNAESEFPTVTDAAHRQIEWGAMDVDRNGRLTYLDALRVLNRLRRERVSPGESESLEPDFGSLDAQGMFEPDEIKRRDDWFAAV